MSGRGNFNRGGARGAPRGGARGGARGGIGSQNPKGPRPPRDQNGARGGRGGARGAPRGGRGGAKAGGRGGKGGVQIMQHTRFPGIYISNGKEQQLLTINSVPGESVYGEKRIVKEDGEGNKIEYRVWNPYRSKLGCTIMKGVDNMPIQPGSKVLYLGAASGTTVSHVSDIVGEKGTVYAVEFAFRPGRDLIGVAKKRQNIVPIIEDARYPLKYRMLVDMVDVIFADVAQPNQAEIIGHNAKYFLKQGGFIIESIKANCIDSTAPSDVVYAGEVEKLRKMGFKPKEQISLEPFERNHATVIAQYDKVKK